MLKFAKFAAIAIIAAMTAAEGYSVNEAHKSRLEQQATRERIDALIGVQREMLGAVNPKATHAICPAKDGRPEVDFGVPHDCDSGRCVTWKGQEMNLEAAGARCQKGTL